MKTHIILLILLAGMVAPLKGQVFDPDNLEGRERIATFKVGFLTKKMDLTRKEAQVFWPVYYEYESRRDKIAEEKEKALQKVKEDESFKEFLKTEFQLEQAKLESKGEFYGKLFKILPEHKVKAYYQAEREFKRKLLKIISERRRK